MWFSILSFSLVITVVYSIKSSAVHVNNSHQLIAALKSAKSGDTIYLKDGYYRGGFTTTNNGKNGHPITLTGSRKAVLSGNKDNYGFLLRANYWILKGFSIADSKKGIVVEGGNKNILEDLEIRNIVQEGVRFQYRCSDNILRKSYIHHTGQGSGSGKGFASGVNIGGNKEADKSQGNHIIDNKIGPNITAEAINVNKDTCCGVIKGNTFIGPQQGHHDSVPWVSIKGNLYTILENKGYHSRKNGFEIIRNKGAGGCGNSVVNNHCFGIPKGGHCVFYTKSSCHNTIFGNI